jgi:hypothetical protein
LAALTKATVGENGLSAFQNWWTEGYLFVIKLSGVCVVSKENISALKEYNIKRHYEIKRGLSGRGIGVQNGDFSLYSGQTGVRVHPASYQWVSGAIFPRVKGPGREADHSSLSSAEVKNGGAIPPLPNSTSSLSALLITIGNNFTFCFCETKLASQLTGVQRWLRRDRMTRLQNRLAQQQSLLKTSVLQSDSTVRAGNVVTEV